MTSLNQVAARARRRDEWIASLPGFWRAVWSAEDRLGVPRRRDLSAFSPLSPAFAPWLRERSRRRQAYPELFAEGERDQGFYAALIKDVTERIPDRYGLDDNDKVPRDSLPEAVDSVYTVLDWVRWHQDLGVEPWSFYREVASILGSFGLAPADDGFVASCVYDSIEYHVDGVVAQRPQLPVLCFDETTLKVVSASKVGLWTHHFEVGRIYVDVTDAIEPAEEIKAVAPIIEHYRARLGVPRPSRPGPGQPSQATYAAYAELLKYEEPNRTWKQVAKMVNDRCGTDFDGGGLGRLVSRDANRQRGREPP